MQLLMRLCLWLIVCCPLSLAIASELEELKFTDLTGQPVTLQDYRGKVVLLNFWATWCPPCVKEMPSLERLQQHFAGQPFTVVAVNTDESATTIRQFTDTLPTALTFPLLRDDQHQAFNQLKLRGLPMSFLLDQQGRQVQTIMGGREWDTPAQTGAIEALLEH